MKGREKVKEGGEERELTIFKVKYTIPALIAKLTPTSIGFTNKPDINSGQSTRVCRRVAKGSIICCRSAPASIDQL